MIYESHRPYKKQYYFLVFVYLSIKTSLGWMDLLPLGTLNSWCTPKKDGFSPVLNSLWPASPVAVIHSR